MISDFKHILLASPRYWLSSRLLNLTYQVPSLILCHASSIFWQGYIMSSLFFVINSCSETDAHHWTDYYRYRLFILLIASIYARIGQISISSTDLSLSFYGILVQACGRMSTDHLVIEELLFYHQLQIHILSQSSEVKAQESLMVFKSFIHGD